MAPLGAERATTSSTAFLCVPLQNIWAVRLVPIGTEAEVLVSLGDKGRFLTRRTTKILSRCVDTTTQHAIIYCEQQLCVFVSNVSALVSRVIQEVV